MSQSSPPDLDVMRRRVENFVLRARRVQQHSLADFETLKSMDSRGFSVGPDPKTGEVVMMLSAPPEEAVESLAARVRPTILQGESVHYGKVLNALRLLAPAKESQALVNVMSTRWRTIDPRSSEVTGYAVMSSAVDGSEPTTYASDNTLAFSWFYGDLVHADEKSQAAGAEFSIRERYLAAVALVGRLAALTLQTLSLIEFLIQRGHLEMKNDGVWSTAVVASQTEWVLPAKLYLADASAAAPADLTTPLGSEWTEVQFPS